MANGGHSQTAAEQAPVQDRETGQQQAQPTSKPEVTETMQQPRISVDPSQDALPAAPKGQVPPADSNSPISSQSRFAPCKSTVRKHAVGVAYVENSGAIAHARAIIISTCI